MPKPLVYVAGPIAGCTWEETVEWRDHIKARLPECRILTPMRGKDFLRTMSAMPLTSKYIGENTPMSEVEEVISNQHAIVVRDHWDVKRCDVLFVNLLPSLATGKASIGTCFELAWAWKYQKPAIVVMNEGNPNDHPFVQEAAYAVVPTTARAIAITRILLDLQPNERLEEEEEE
jgi:hypothetical protein